MASRSSMGICPTLSAFDFQDSEFSSAQRHRRTSIAIVAVTLAVVCGLLLVGMQAVLAARKQEAAATASQAQTSSYQDQLSKISQGAGIPAAQLQQHIADRSRVYAGAVSHEVDVVKLTNAIAAAVPSGSVLSSVAFTSPAPAPAQSSAPAASSSSSPSVPSSSSSPTAAPAPAAPVGYGSVAVTGSVQTFAGIKAWQQALAAVPGLSSVTVTWSGAPPSVSVSLTAQITPVALTARAQSALQGGGS